MTGSNLRQGDGVCGLRASGTGNRARRLVCGEHVDASLVTVCLAPRRRQENLDDARRFVFAVHTRADRDHVGVVVLAAETCRFGAPGERGTHAPVSYTHLRAHETVLDLV